ncbi:MAG: ThiF family protein [Thermoleophilia bacterium]|nr:ThiF family protein [Thermoleophilia bacterium]
MEAEHSRMLLLAQRVTGHEQVDLLERQDTAITHVSMEICVPGTFETALLLLTTLRRGPGVLVFDPAELSDAQIEELTEATLAIDSTRPLQQAAVGSIEADVHILLGTTARASAIRVIPDGYGMQLATDDSVDVQQARAPNALGYMCAASFAACERFKRIVVDNPARKSEHLHLSFCPVSLGSDVSAAPALDMIGPIDSALVGVGAIGTATVKILGGLALGGRIVACDPERYAPENKGTYSVGGEQEVRDAPYKVHVAKELLEAAGYTVIAEAITSMALIDKIDRSEITPPRIALSGLDTIRSRRETQRLWCDDLIDGGTGDTAAGLHHGRPGGPCLSCFFPDLARGPDPYEILAAATGLPIARLRDAESALTDDDLAGLSDEQLATLEPLVGTKMCGLTSAAGLSELATDDYLPAVPFVSQMAACLVVGRFISLAGRATSAVNFFQLDMLHGPQYGGEVRDPRGDCYCQQRSSIVNTVRSRRWPIDEIGHAIQLPASS